jgi:hypothetical protein
MSCFLILFEIESGSLEYPPDKKLVFLLNLRWVSTKSFLGIQSPSVKIQ